MPDWIHAEHDPVLDRREWRAQLQQVALAAWPLKGDDGSHGWSATKTNGHSVTGTAKDEAEAKTRAEAQAQRFIDGYDI